ncbi:MAG: DNA recombination protein RmuC [Acidobacteria bacterium]|nr:DNA recombination protein RmuC [Acidobacteriota bacterium]
MLGPSRASVAPCYCRRRPAPAHPHPRMTEITVAVVAALLGGGVAWLLATRARTTDAELEARARSAEGIRDELRRQLADKDGQLEALRKTLEDEARARTEAQTRLDQAREGLRDQQRLVEETTTRLTDTFRALSADALKSNNQSFLDLAKQSFESIVAETKGDVGKRQEAIDGLIRPIQETLKRYEQQITAMEETRQRTFGGLEEQLKHLSASQGQLQRETGNLVKALRTPHVRGRWGEMTLHRVVELAGMAAHCDYEPQVTISGDDGRLRPDLLVRLPDNRSVVVDSKVPLDAYLDALEAEDEDHRRDALARHAQQLRTHMTQLAAKSYWEQLPQTPEFVVMFVPGESLFAAASEVDHALLEDGMARQVVMATPTTLIAVLKAVAYGWRQEQIAENAQAISALGRQLYERVRTLADHVEEVGRALGKAVAAHNRAVGSMENRVFPAARRFKELGAASGDDIPTVEPIEQAPRLFTDLDKS